MKSPRLTEDDLRTFLGNREKGRVRGTGPVSAVADSQDAGHASKVSSVTSSPYRSKWEATYASKLELEKQAGLVKGFQYEGLSLRLSKGQYHRPDFLIWHCDGSIEIAQVKGWHKNMRAGMKGLKWAAQLHPWFTWTLKRWTGKGWDSHYVEV